MGDWIGVYRNKGEGMACQRVCFALLMGALTASSAVSPARAQHCGPNCAPVLCTVHPYRDLHQVRAGMLHGQAPGYKVVCEKVACTTYRTEYVCEPREKMLHRLKRIPCEKTIMKKVCRNITVCEERTIMQSCYQYQR